MGKLQLYITIAYKGYREMLDINADSKIKGSVCDLSHVVGKIKYKTGNMNIFFMLRYIPEGVFLTVLRTIPALKPDHLAAWIFIPYDIKISTPEIEEVIETVIKAISNSKITSETYAELCKLFEKDYDNTPLAAAIAPNRGKHTAYRYYGDITGYLLSDLIGTKRYQTSYLPYAEVILADKSVVQDINGHQLTDEPLEQMVKLFPPVSPDPAFRPTIFGCEFDKPYLAPLMGKVEIRWFEGENPVAEQAIMVNRPNMRPDTVALEELMQVSAISPDTPAQTERHQAPAKPHTQDHTHTAQRPSAKTPYFQSQTRTYQTEQGEPLVQRPESPWKSRLTALWAKVAALFGSMWADPYTRAKIIWAMIGFAAGVLLTLACVHISGSGTVNTPKVLDLSSDTLEMTSPVEIVDIEASTQPWTEEALLGTSIERPTDTSMTAAITYLEGFKTWTKSELEKYPELQGLYEDLNTFNKERLVQHWGPKLKKSKRFNKIEEHARQAIKRGKKPRVPDGQKTFNPPGKENIKIMTYLNTIDP